MLHHDDEQQAGRRRSCTARRIAVTAVALAVMLLGATEAPAASAGSREAASTPVTERASLGALLGLPPQPAVVPEALAAELTGFTWRFALAAAEPTPAAVPPTPTATAPPPAPAQRPVLPRPAAPPPSQPTVPPPPPAPTPTAVAPTPAPPPPSALDVSPMNAFEQALFDAINARRIGAGMAPLRANLSLVAIGRMRSQDMVDHDYFAHTSPVSGDDAFSLMRAHGVPFAWAGENLALNNYSLDDCVRVADQALWDSPPHRGNTLGPHYTDMGVAMRSAPDGRHYFTVIFTGP